MYPFGAGINRLTSQSTQESDMNEIEVGISSIYKISDKQLKILRKIISFVLKFTDLLSTFDERSDKNSRTSV